MDHHLESEVAWGDGGGGAAGGEQLDLTIDLDGEQLIFSDDPFPLLPDFPCINSPPASPMPTSAGNPCFSSSPSTSSSASSSWVFNSAASSGSAIVPTLSEERDVIDILNEIDLDPAFDPSLLFSDERMMVEPVSDTQTSGEGGIFGGSNGNSLNCLFGRDGSSELAEIFLEWLKSNKDSISREDLRNIKIKKATIDSALRRLGSDKQGRAKLFKLILAWVQNHHLQKKHRLQHHHENAFPAFSSPYQNHNQHFPFNPVPIIPNNSPNMEYNNQAEHNITGRNTWNPYCDPSMMMNYTGGAMPYQFPGSSFVGCPTGWTGPPNFGVAAPPPPYLFPAPSAPIAPAHYPVGFTAGQQMYPGQPFVASVPAPAPAPAPAPDPISATREARKKRAQQRRYSVRSHNNNISKSQQQVHHHQPQKNHISRLAAAQETQKTSTLRSKQIDVREVPPAPTPTPPPTLPQASSQAPTPLLPQVSSRAPPQPQVSSPATPQPQVVSPLRQQLSLQNGARHQGLKGDKKMTLLFQKMLKQSDVNGLGRIVLPKKEAELHLPALEGRDGISLVMEEIGTSRVWSMRYRFWPNNKSRMYLLENTAEFIRLNGLQEGDFIVIYLDTKCNKYLIKGIKIQNSEAQRAANRKRCILEKVGAAKSRILGSPSAQRYTVIDIDKDDDDDYDISMLEAI